jgi:hypothetical protein
MNDAKYIGLDVHQGTISAVVLDSTGIRVMESILETKAATVLQFIHGLRRSLHVAIGSPDRADKQPLIPLFLVAKVGFDGAVAAKYTVDAWKRHRAFCFWCMVASWNSGSPGYRGFLKVQIQPSVL